MRATPTAMKARYVQRSCIKTCWFTRLTLRATQGKPDVDPSHTAPADAPDKALLVRIS